MKRGLNNYVKDINSNFSVELWFKNDIVLVFGDFNIATFNEFNPDNFTIEETDSHIAYAVAKTGVINKFYNKTYKLLNEQIPKYTVRITNDSENYLHANSCVGYKDIYFDILHESSVWVGEFTKSEIESFKKRKDLAIDWSKAIIEKVKND